MNELPQGWVETPLESIVDILDSQRIPLNSDERNARIAGKDVSKLVPYYGATGQVGFIDDYIFDEPIVLLGEDGVPFFDLYKHKAYRVSGKSWVNNHAHVIRAKPQVTNNVYIEKYLNYFDYTGVVSGSTRLKLTQGAMREISVKLAPLPEQKRIADKLDALLTRVDATRERLDRIPQILKQFRQSVLAAATSGRLTEVWRKSQEYCSSDLDIELPSTWDVFTIGDLAEVKGGKRLPKGDALVIYDTGFPYIRAGQLKNGTVNPEDQLYLTKETQKQISRYIVNAGDVYITIVGACIGDAGIIPAEYAGANLTENAAKICGFKSPLLAEYLSMWLRSSTLQEIIQSEIKSGAQGKLALLRIKTLPVPYPYIEEQKEIVRRVEALFSLADKLEARYQQARAQVEKLTPALLAKAFRGELVEQDPNDEPAEKLLERIRATREEGSSMKKKLIKNKG